MALVLDGALRTTHAGLVLVSVKHAVKMGATEVQDKVLRVR